MAASKAKLATGTVLGVCALLAGVVPASPTYVVIGELKTVKVTDATGTVDVTSFDSAGFADFIIARRDFKVSADGNLITPNPGDLIVTTAANVPEGVGISVTCTDGRKWTGFAITTQRDVDLTDANPNKVSYSWQIKGKLTEA